MQRYAIVFLSSFAVLVFFLTPNINSGDAGELITASYFLGVAHPSGYPLYLLISKAFTLLPFGNIGFKVALVSATFSAVSLTLLYLVMFTLTRSDLAAAYAAASLLTSYSYFTQSVIAKFYTFNLFLVLSIFALWMMQMRSRDGGDRPLIDLGQTFYLTPFLFGLITANHNTGVLMFLPVVLAIFFCRREILLTAGRRNISGLFFIPLTLFLSGFMINAYLFARGGDDLFINVFHVRNLKEFSMMISRQTYGKIGTITVAGNFFSDPASFWYGLKNFVSLLGNNFSPLSYPLFFLGCLYLARKNTRAFAVSLAALLVYGPLFTKLALPFEHVSQMDSYVYGNQYYLPALAFYALFLGAGFFQATVWLGIARSKSLGRIVPAAAAIFFAVFLWMRSGDSNYRREHIPYQTAKDTYSILPVDSIYLAFGDSERFQGRYLRLIGRYREDICHLNAVSLQKTEKGLTVCSETGYGSISPEVFEKEFPKAAPLMERGRFYSSAATSDFFPIEKFVEVKRFSLAYLCLPKRPGTGSEAPGAGTADRFISRRLPTAEKLCNPDVCIKRSTDDLFSDYLCNKYTAHMNQLINFHLAPRPAGTQRN